MKIETQPDKKEIENKKVLYDLPFSSVRLAYVHQGRFYSPLLDPADKIENILREEHILRPREHLDTFDNQSESFPIVIYQDKDKLTKIQRIRLWLMRKIMPK